jgi:MoxR-like ATPase
MFIHDWNDASATWELVETVLKSGAGPIHLSGPPAIGKSRASYMVSHNGLPIYPVYVTEDMSAAKLIGYERFNASGASVFTPGPMLLAWGMTGKPGRLILEEIDAASGDVLTTCLSALDDPAHAQYILPTGEVVRPDPDCYQVVCTSNEPRHTLPAALADRCSISFELTEPHPSAIGALPTDLQDAATKSFAIRESNRRVSMRQWFAFARLSTRLSRPVAAAAVFGRSADDILAAYALSTAITPER